MILLEILELKLQLSRCRLSCGGVAQEWGSVFDLACHSGGNTNEWDLWAHARKRFVARSWCTLHGCSLDALISVLIVAHLLLRVKDAEDFCVLC